MRCRQPPLSYTGRRGSSPTIPSINESPASSSSFWMSSRRARKVRAPPTDLSRFTQKKVVGVIDREVYDRGPRSTRASSTGAPRRRYRGLGSLRGRGARRGASGGAGEGGPPELPP